MPAERGRQARKAVEALLPDGGYGGASGNVGDGRLSSLPGSRGDLVRVYDATGGNVVGLVPKTESRNAISGSPERRSRARSGGTW